MNRDNIFVAAIGASAGGLKAIENLIEVLEPNENMAYVIIQHLSPDHQSYMDEILSRKTNLEIIYAKNGLLVEPNKIYLIPPNKLLKIYEDKLYLDNLKHHDSNNLPINTFFKSLAFDKYSRAISIVLSGTGSDGTEGSKVIKRSGGITIAQSPDSCEFDSMPRNSIDSGYIDYILPPVEIAYKLNEISRSLFYSKENLNSNKRQSFYKIIDIIKIKKDVDFKSYKLETISRRIEKRIKAHNLTDVNEYYSLLKNSEKEIDRLYRELLIGVTEFFRDEEYFKILYEKAIINLVNDSPEGHTIRIWDVGCSSGEESYTIAFLFEDAIEKINKNVNYKIFATDLNEDSLSKANQGIYSNNIISDIPKEYLEKYFIKKGNKYHVSNEIKKKVIFSKHNIVNDPPFSKIDLVSCRNLLIYLTSDEQEKILSMFHFALNFNSYLFLGPSESIGSLTDMFKIIDTKAKLFNYLSGSTNKKSTIYNYSKIISRNEKKLQNDTEISNNSPKEKNPHVFENLLEEFLPPSILIDPDFNLIHIFKGAGRFMEISDGKISLNILSMFSKDMRFIIESLVLKSKKNNSDNKNYITDKGVVVSVRSLKDLGMFLVSFEENDEYIEPKKYNVVDINENMKERIDDLENKLIKKDDDLQKTIQQLETSNEELQSANEQLISSNEELQSTNEELQSVNEELYTVNSEYQSKIEELTEANNDLNNYLNANNIGTIFLDKTLQIRKFTPSAKKEFSLMNVDLGRPIYHITNNFDYNDIYEDCKTVLDDMKPVEKYLVSKANKGKVYLLRILPYLTTENVMKGVIITFLDITDIRKNNSNNISLLNLSDEIFIVLSFDGYVDIANNCFINYISKTKKYIFNNSFFSLIDDNYRQNIIASFEEAIKSAEIIKSKIKFKNKEKIFEIFFERSDGKINCFIKFDGEC
ncbi:MAG: CheR family methyltransferase [Thermotogota bacterium]